MKNIKIVGIGMGNRDTLTIGAEKIIKESHVLIGAKRMLGAFEDVHAQKVPLIKTDDIISFVNGCDKENITILMSGDVSFFSGAKGLREALGAQLIPGIATISYFGARVGVSYDDCKILSAHGRQTNFIPHIKKNYKTFLLTGGENTVRRIIDKLNNSFLGETTLYIGENLSYDSEKITIAKASELKERDFATLSAMFVLNDEWEENTFFGLDDDEFLRAKVPMTKSEIRGICLSKLRIKRGDIIYDIGAGSGSVAVEMARLAPFGTVYGVERSEEALKLIAQNRDKFKVQNLKIIPGSAAHAIAELEAPDKVFIGGSGGDMEDIVKIVLNKNPKARIVINAITLESVMEGVNILKKYNLIDVDIAQISVAKAKAVGRYNMMMGQNPIYIISGEGAGI